MLQVGRQVCVGQRERSVGGNAPRRVRIGHRERSARGTSPSWVSNIAGHWESSARETAPSWTVPVAVVHPRVITSLSPPLPQGMMVSRGSGEGRPWGERAAVTGAGAVIDSPRWAASAPAAAAGKTLHASPRLLAPAAMLTAPPSPPPAPAPAAARPFPAAASIVTVTAAAAAGTGPTV